MLLEEDKFWLGLDKLIEMNNLIIDRPKGSVHPRQPSFVYPFDYGYLEGMLSGDGKGIDVWVGSLPAKVVTGIIFTVDLQKKDAEVKILLSCTTEEMQEILILHNIESQSGILLERQAKNL